MALDLVPIVDTSIYQFAGVTMSTPPADVKPPDLAKAKALNVQGVMARATIGTRTDPTFPATVRAAKAVGMHAGGYTFVEPHLVDAVKAADIFGFTYNAAAPTLPPMVDVEDFNRRAFSNDSAGNTAYEAWFRANWPPRKLADYLHAFVDRTKELTGRQPALYGYPWWLRTRLGMLLSEFSACDLIVASYLDGVTWPLDAALWSAEAQLRDSDGPSVAGWAGWQMTFKLPTAPYGFAGTSLDGDLIRREVWDRWTVGPELAVLRAENATLRTEKAVLRAENATLRTEKATLRTQLDALRARVARALVELGREA